VANASKMTAMVGRRGSDLCQECLKSPRSSIRPPALLQNRLSSSLLLTPDSSALSNLLLLAFTFNALGAIVLLEAHPHAVFLRELRLVLLLSHLASRLMASVRGRASGCFTTCNLPFHELGESAFLISGKLRVRADLCYAAVGSNADDDVAALDCAKAVGDGDCGVVALEELGEGLIYESLGFGVEGGSGFVEYQDVRILEQSASDGDALLLSTGELSTTGASGGVETFRLGVC